MNAEFAKKALEKVGNPNVLVNLISRRVRQLNSGGGKNSRPLVADTGNMGAADIALLERTHRRLERAGLADRVRLLTCTEEAIGLDTAIDFALAFWMAHEVPDKPRFFREIFALLKAGGRLLLVEPKFHVTLRSLERTLAVCRETGFSTADQPVIALSRAVLLGKG